METIPVVRTSSSLVVSLSNAEVRKTLHSRSTMTPANTHSQWFPMESHMRNSKPPLSKLLLLCRSPRPRLLSCLSLVVHSLLLTMPGTVTRGMNMSLRCGIILWIISRTMLRRWRRFWLRKLRDCPSTPMEMEWGMAFTKLMMWCLIFRTVPVCHVRISTMVCVVASVFCTQYINFLSNQIVFNCQINSIMDEHLGRRFKNLLPQNLRRTASNNN